MARTIRFGYLTENTVFSRHTDPSESTDIEFEAGTRVQVKDDPKNPDNVLVRAPGGRTRLLARRFVEEMEGS